MLTEKQRRNVLILMAVVFLCSAALSEVIRPGHDEYVKAARAVTTDVREVEVSESSFHALLPTVLGIREVLASLMWVQADDYFHRGEYRPIIRMVRQITAIDPHQIDVYATGAWHMAYNFMDKRLIEDGVQFLADGCRNNRAVYDLFFELGYMHYDKTKDYPKAVDAYEQASTKGTTTGKKIPPSYVRHQLAHAIEKMGDIDRCLEQWDRNLVTALEVEKGEGVHRFGTAGPNTAAAYHNRYITARRRNERLAALALREKNGPEAARLWEANQKLAQDWLKQFPGHPQVTTDLQTANNKLEAARSGRLPATQPAEILFHYTVTRTAPRVLQIEGTANVLDLSRVHIRFRDRDYEQRIANGFNFKMENCSLEWDNTSIRKGKFRWTLKLNVDPADMGRPAEEIYPLKADEYVLSLTYNPRLQAAFIQDVYGWNGEGLTTKPQYLKEDPERAGVINEKQYPLRTVHTEVVLKKDDITAKGRKLLHTE